MKRLAVLLAFLLSTHAAVAFYKSGATSPPLTFTALANGASSSTIAGSGSYSGTAPTGIVTATWGGGCSGNSTVTGFSVSANVWSAAFSTPATAGSNCTVAVTDNRSDAATSPGVTITVVTTNAVYPLTMPNYQANGGCSTNYYVNGSTGSDSYNGTSQTFTSGSTGPWATITHAQSALSGSHPGYCINVAAGTYAGDFATQCHGNTNSYTGYCALRCAPNGSTLTAQPYLYTLTNGASGSMPVCRITNSSHNDIQLGGVVSTSGGDSTPYNYIIIDGFEITDLTTISSNIANVAYNSGTGKVTATLSGIAVTNFTYNSGTGVGTWTLASSPLGVVVGTTGFATSGLTGTGSIASANGNFIAASANGTTVTANIGTGLTMSYSSAGTLTPPIAPSMCMTVAGVTGTGSISQVNGYHCATTGTTGTTIIFPIAPGLAMTYSSGGTITTPDAHGSGSSVGSVGIGQGPTDGSNNNGAHHQVIINNYVHDMGGAGIQTQSAALFFVWENLVVNNAWSNPFAESGIDITYNPGTTFPTYTAGPLDGAWGAFGATGHTATIDAVIANNITHNNGNPIGATDGNGIIIDTSNLTANVCGTPGLTYGTLIYGNFSYLNGGRGINMFNSSNTVVLNNTAWSNATSIWNNNAASGAGPYINCGSNNYVKNNIGVAVPATSGLPEQAYAGQSVYTSVVGRTVLWNNNILYDGGTTTTCGGATSVSGTTCFNGLDQIFSSGTKPTPWSGATTYSGSTNNTLSGVTGSDGNTYSSLSSSANLNHNPVSDAPTPGTQGSWWQNNGAPNNLFEDPMITSPGGFAPNWQLQSTSPGINASGANVTGLGGYTVSTPNIGAY